MNIDRKDLLRALDSCTPGLSSKENVDQSNCYCFVGGTIKTYNDEILCQHETALTFTGAVPAKPLRELLQKMTEDEIEVTTTTDKIRIKGSRRRSEINMNPDILLPTGTVEEPSEWTEVPPAFSDALGMVAGMVDDDQSNVFAYVHFCPGWLEATDNHQAIRYGVATGVKSNVMVRGDSCKALRGMGIASIAETETWVHWKTFSGLQVSVRKDTRVYPDLTEIFAQPKLSRVHIPGSVADILDRASPFMREAGIGGKRAQIVLSEGKLIVRAINGNGWYEEIKDIEYDGEKLQFSADPKHIANALKLGLPCDVTASSLKLKGDAFVYVVSLEEVK